MKKLILILFAIFIVTTLKAQTTVHPILKGRFIMKGTNCAGFDFTNEKTVLWYAELICNAPTEMRLTWLSKDIFTLRDKEPINKGCAPRVYVFHIVKNDGKQLILKSPWMGWGKDSEDTEVYIRE